MPPELRTVAEPEQLDEHLWQQPHRSALFTWLLAVVGPCAAFGGLVAPDLAAHGVLAMPIVVIALLLLVSVLMALTSFSNPGTIALPSVRRQAADCPKYYVVDGIKVSARFCHACGMPRPPRAAHCPETGRCVDRWDHYCPWVGTSIGRRNYVWFVSFVHGTMLLAAAVGTGCVLQLRLFASRLVEHVAGSAPSAPPPAAPHHVTTQLPLWLRAAGEAPLSCLLLAYAVLVSCLLATLGLYHWYLITSNLTTLEHLRGLPHDANPFDRGVLTNIGEALCPKCVPPLPWRVYDAASDPLADLEAQGSGSDHGTDEPPAMQMTAMPTSSTTRAKPEA